MNAVVVVVPVVVGHGRLPHWAEVTCLSILALTVVGTLALVADMIRLEVAYRRRRRR